MDKRKSYSERFQVKDKIKACKYEKQCRMIAIS